VLGERSIELVATALSKNSKMMVLFYPAVREGCNLPSHMSAWTRTSIKASSSAHLR
jgi:hypothetical protein